MTPESPNEFNNDPDEDILQLDAFDELIFTMMDEIKDKNVQLKISLNVLLDSTPANDKNKENVIQTKISIKGFCLGDSKEHSKDIGLKLKNHIQKLFEMDTLASLEDPTGNKVGIDEDPEPDSPFLPYPESK